MQALHPALGDDPARSADHKSACLPLYDANYHRYYGDLALAHVPAVSHGDTAGATLPPAAPLLYRSSRPSAGSTQKTRVCRPPPFAFARAHKVRPNAFPRAVSRSGGPRCGAGDDFSARGRSARNWRETRNEVAAGAPEFGGAR
jgi:hypothetical protein